MISPILVEQRADGRWVATCRSKHCPRHHEVAVARTADAAQAASEKHLRELHQLDSAQEVTL